MKTIKLNFSEIENTLTRGEMKNIMAGSGGGNCYQGQDECELFAATGCWPTFGGSGSCEGSDGCTYSNAKKVDEPQHEWCT